MRTKGSHRSTVCVSPAHTEPSVSISHLQVTLSSVQSCLTLCDPMDCSLPGFPVHHQLPELAQTLVHWVGDAIQPSHPLLSPSPPAFSLSQHQDLFQGVSSLHQVAKVFSASASAFLFFFPFIFISWRLIILQSCSGFCHTLT